jgi:outer membrane lipoprotein SlyB
MQALTHAHTSALSQHGQQASFSDRLRHSKALIPTMAVMGVTVLALAAALLVKQSDAQGDATRLAAPVAMQSSPAAPATQPLVAAAALAPTGAVAETLAPAPVQKPVVKAVPKPVTKPAVKPEPAAAQAPATVPPPAQTAPVVVTQAPVCATCGTVESVTPVERRIDKGSGVGAVAGGVVGGVLGNQVGEGSGKTIATVLGAIGGGYAGNAIEKNVRKTTVYQIRVRMEDGSRRTLERAQPVAAGTRVTVEGNSLRINS